MSRFYSYLNSTSNIINLYKGEIPFAIFLKQYFAKEKKFGSKDRKQISALCYNYFRVANALNIVEKEEQFLIASFLCESTPNPILAFLKPEFNDLIEELSALNRQVDKMRVQSFKIQARITEIINGSSLEFVRKICK